MSNILEFPKCKVKSWLEQHPEVDKSKHDVLYLSFEVYVDCEGLTGHIDYGFKEVCHECFKNPKDADFFFDLVKTEALKKSNWRIGNE